MTNKTLRLSLHRERGFWWIVPISLLAFAMLVMACGQVVPDGIGLHRAGTESALIQANLADLPLSFIANIGQTNPDVRYHVQEAGYSVFFTDSGVVFNLAQRGKNGEVTLSVVQLRFEGAVAGHTVEGLGRQPGNANFLRGNEPANWYNDVPTYEAVAYRELYPGIDLVYWGTGGHIKSEFVLEPSSDPDNIRLVYGGADAITLREDGALVLQTAQGEFVESAPEIYQVIGGQRLKVDGGYLLLGGGQVRFWVGAYDGSHPLVIDPELAYSTNVGGSSDFERANAIAIDSSGNAYVTGLTQSLDLPTENPFQPSIGGCCDAFVSKLNSEGSAFVYSTYLGGSVVGPGGNDPVDEGTGITVDSSGNAYITGNTRTTDFPTTPGAYDRTFNYSQDAFITILDPTGSSLVYSTYLGGATNPEISHDIAVDTIGKVYITGETRSWDFPTTADALQSSKAGSIDAFVAMIDPSESGPASLIYSTYLGGRDSADEYSGNTEGLGIAVDDSGLVHVAGTTTAIDFPTTTGAFQTTYGGGPGGGSTFGDAFLLKLDLSREGLASLLYSTYFGGSGRDIGGGIPQVGIGGGGIAIDIFGYTYLTGSTSSTDLPTTADAFQPTYGGGAEGGHLFGDAFVAKFDLSETGDASLVYSTYLGGSESDMGHGIAADEFGKAYVTGSTPSSGEFPIEDPLQPNSGGTFVTVFNAAGTALVFSTRVTGDQGMDISVDGSSNVYVVSRNGSVVKISPSVPPETTITSAVDGNGISVINNGSTPSNSIAFEFTGSDDVDVAGFECSLDAAAFSLCGSPTSFDGLTATGHAFRVRAFDTPGNRDPSPATLSWTIVDTTPPNTTIVSAVDHKGDPVENGGSTRSNSLTFEFTGTDNVGVASFECSLDGSPFAACASFKTYTRLGSGNHTFDVQAIDTSGNIDPSPATFTWIRGTPTQQGTVTGTVIDSSTSLHIQVATVSADTGQNTTSDANGDYTLDGVPTGDRTLTASATGYVAQIQQTTVLDGETVVLNFALEPDTGSGETTWTRQFGTSSADRALGISIDSSGAYVVGYTLGTFPGQPATESGDAFVRKYSADGSEIWTRQFGSFSLADQALAVSVNSSGVYVAGYTGGDAFLRKYSVDGNLVWTSQFGSTTFADKAQGVSVDSSGVYVTGSTFSSDSKDAFVRKYDVDGILVWTRQFGSTSLADEALAISVDPSGVYVAGYTFSSSSKDAFISKYGADGKEVWTNQFGSLSLADEAVGISVDSSGVYVAVQTIDDFVRKYDLDGNEVWTNQLTDKPRAIFVDSSGVYVTGGGGFVRKYDVNGSEVWTRLSLADGLLGVSVDSSGVYVAGRIGGDAFAAKLPLTGTMHVASIDVSFLTEGRKIEAVAQVRIVDEEGFPVPGATVTGDWFLNGKLLKEGTFETTGSDGIVTISSGRINKGKSGDTIGFCVTGVTGSHNYVASGNVETCDGAPKP